MSFPVLPESKIHLTAMMITVIIVVVLGPLFAIWSLNELFKLQIEYSFRSWLAITWLWTMIHGLKLVANRN